MPPSKHASVTNWNVTQQCSRHYNASYSVRYIENPGGSRFMYLTRVLVGQYCTGHFTMVLPPPKDPSRPEVLYDYVVDLCETPSIFVVFFDNQCYPEYLITFQ